MRVIAAENVLIRKIDTEAVLLNLNTETYYMLNSSGIRMWEVLTSEGTVEEAVSTLAAEYSVSEDLLRNDVNELIESLHAAKLIEISQ